MLFRRHFLLGAVAAIGGGAVACSPLGDHMSLPFAPWHMWGTSQVVTVVNDARWVNTVQLAKINYKRPENWRFFLAGRVIGGTITTSTQTELYAEFNVMLGVGRSVFNTEKERTNPPATFNPFALMHWTIPLGLQPGIQNWNRKYLTEVRAPPLDDTDQTVRELIDHLPAQDIQCQARVRISQSDPGATFQVEVSSFFAPNVHLRPDWYKRQFPGAEEGGT